MARYNSRKVGRTAAFGKTDGMKQFAQDQGAVSYGLQAVRSNPEHKADMGDAPIVGAYRGKKAIVGNASPITKGFSAERRKYGGAARAKKHYQKPAASFRQYDFPALAPIPPQGK